MNTAVLLTKFGRSFAAGTVLFREGEPGDEMYVIHSGLVRITRTVGQKETLLAELPAGEFFGEMAIITDSPRSATATVSQDAQLIVIDGHTFEAMIRGSTEIALRLIKRLAQRLAQANNLVDVLLFRGPDHRVVHFLRNEAASSGTPHAKGILLQVTDRRLAEQLGLSLLEVEQVIERLISSRLIARAEGLGYYIHDVQSLMEFLEYLEISELLESVS